MKVSFKKSFVVLACIVPLLLIPACSGKTDGQSSKVKKEKKTEKLNLAPHGTVFYGGYWNIDDEGNASYVSDAIPGSDLEICLSGGKAETVKNPGDEGGEDYVHVKLDDESVWVPGDCIVLSSVPQYVLETGTDVYLYEAPDEDSVHAEKLATDTLLAFLGQCETSSKYAEAQKFARVKIPAGKRGEYTEGYVRMSDIDDNPAHIAMIQVSKRYSQLMNEGSVSADILNELEDTMEELKSWSGK